MKRLLSGVGAVCLLGSLAVYINLVGVDSTRSAPT